MNIPGYIRVTDTQGQRHLLETRFVKDVIEVLPTAPEFSECKAMLHLDYNGADRKKGYSTVLEVRETFDFICEEMYCSSFMRKG